MIVSDASHANGALPPPPPLAGEGWGEGFSAVENPQEEKALTRVGACHRARLRRDPLGATSPASGRGKPSSRRVNSSQRANAPGVKP
ncbi:hypothetical protein ABIA43_003159 [Bradyrhizobium sp. USDA 328]